MEGKFMFKEKRKHQRISTLNLFYYECLDEQDNPLGEGMGRTLDISEGGLLIETHDKIEAKYILMLAVGFEDELVDIKCEVVYSRPGNNNMYESGVSFIEANEKVIRIIQRLSAEFVQHKGDNQSS